ncbi:hypothetical protein A2899_02840 [Candidatus Amesbacteria bacterium RIFCSPLOWO2_01_FULL_49_25]|nr:MAG: hypothetical protein A2899_02840 [Candidatus Amesbacteria bacterium RIFCSPLOWO2_01_FULL_49_25]
MQSKSSRSLLQTSQHMNAQIQSRLDKLRTDYDQVRGYPFAHFFCPILFRDEDTPLCKAHIVNRSFSDSSRKWTVQRKDVDEFYGSNFEADFSSIQYKESRSLGKTLTDKALYKTFTPKISIDDKPVDYFIARGDIPEQFTPVLFENDDGHSVFLGLKISPEEYQSLVGQKIEIEISKDVRMPSLVSLIKTAHLTLFEMIGYRYAFSAAGHFTGWDILGKFYWQNHNKPKSEILANAQLFFREFTHMARPIQSQSPGIKGTITDGLLFLCRSTKGFPWAFIVFVKTSQLLHAVIIPILDQVDNAERFYNFLRNENEILEATLCRFNKDHWEISKESTRLQWPKSGILYPDF